MLVLLYGLGGVRFFSFGFNPVPSCLQGRPDVVGHGMRLGAYLADVQMPGGRQYHDDHSDCQAYVEEPA